MVEIKLISIILWSVTASLLMIFILISSSIYRVNKDKIFIYYAFYCFFLSAYVIYKFDFYQPYLDWIIERRKCRAMLLSKRYPAKALKSAIISIARKTYRGLKVTHCDWMGIQPFAMLK